jgi:hypothetical protein
VQQPAGTSIKVDAETLLNSSTAAGVLTARELATPSPLMRTANSNGATASTPVVAAILA